MTPEANDGAPRGRYILSLFGVRGVILGLGFVSSVLLARVVIDDLGTSLYGVVSIISSIPLLIPFADFGLGSAIVNATSRFSLTGDAILLRSTLKKSWILLGGAAALVASVSLLFFLSGSWQRILGLTEVGAVWISLGATLVGWTFAVTLLVSPGLRVLQGLGRIRSMTTLTGSVPVLTGAGALGIYVLGGEPLLYVLVTPVLSLAANVCAVVVAWRALMRFPGWRVTNAQSRAQLVESQPVRFRYLLAFGSAGMLVATAVAVMSQGGRLALAHTSSPAEVGYFSLVWTVYAAALSVVGVYGQFLWPHFQKRQVSGTFSSGELVHEIRRAGLIGAGLGIGMAVAAPFVIFLMSGSFVTYYTIAFACGCLVFQALHQPSAMFLMDSAGLRAQSLVTVAAAVLVISLTLVLGEVLGSTAPFLATFCSVALLQFPLTAAIALRRIKKKEQSP